MVVADVLPWDKLSWEVLLGCVGDSNNLPPTVAGFVGYLNRLDELLVVPAAGPPKRGLSLAGLKRELEGEAPKREP